MRRTALAIALTAFLLAPPAQAFTLPGFGQHVTSQEQHIQALVAGLRGAIASGDSKRVLPLFPVGGPAYAWLGQRWGEMRKGTLDPIAWEADFERLYGDHDRIGGILTLRAREARGKVVAGRFEIEAWRRGKAWVVGDPLPMTRPDWALTRHDLRVDLRKAGELTAEDLITIAPSGPDRRAFFRLDPRLKVSAATHAGQPVAYQQRGELLFVQLPESPHPFELSLTYAGALAGADHVGPDDSLLRAETAWYPRPVGEPPPAVYRVMAMVRPGERAIAPGDFVGVDRYEDGWLHHWTTPAPAPGTSLIAGTLAGAELTIGKTRLAAFARPGREPAAAGMLVEATRILNFYGPRFGAYPHAKLALVEAGDIRAYGAGDAVALPTAAFEYMETGDAVLAREIARAWTGRVAYRGTPGEQAFLDEGVAAYMDLLYHWQRDGLPGFRARLGSAQKRWGEVVGTPQDVPLAQAGAIADDEARRRLTLDKGAIVMNMLRRRLGPQVFDAGLARFFAKHAGGSAGIPEFRKAFEEGAAGQHLGAFFDQWLNRRGRPSISAEGVDIVPLPGGKYQVRGALVQEGRPWHVLVPLVVEAGGQQRVYEIDVRGAATGFALVTPGRPHVLLVDPLRDTLLAPAADVELAPLLPAPPKPTPRPTPKPARPSQPAGY